MGLKINIDWDSSVNSAPAAFKTDVTAAVQYLENTFTNPVTITIGVGYGEVDGQTLGSDDLGESIAEQYSGNFSYSQIANALIAENAPGSSTLPASSPLSGTIVIATAEAKALGLSTYSGIDGWVGFSSTASFSYGNGTTPPANEYYFIGTVEHEITEDMGRVSDLNAQPRHYSPMDLYRYSSPGVRTLKTGGSGSTAYFSINNGTTNLGSWNNQTSNGDLGDWYPSGPAPGGNDSFNDFSDPGVINEVSPDDVTLMAALGWTTTSAAAISISSVAASPAMGDLDAGDLVTITLAMSGAITVTGSPTLSLNDGGTASYDRSESTSTALAFDYMVAAGQNTAALAVTGLNLPSGATITDGGGNNAVLTLPSSATFSGLEIDTTPPAQVNDNTLSAGRGQAVVIPASNLQFTDNLSTHAQETYTVTAGPADGLLLKSGAPTTSFTQADIDNGLITYQETANGVSADSFAFTVADAAGNTTAAQQFQILIPQTPVAAGNAELLWHSDSGQNLLWNVGDDQLAASSTLSATTSDWHVAGIGDFNGDGSGDILWHDDSGQNLIWNIQNNQFSSSATLPTTTSDWHILGIGDFNADGSSDILWHDDDGQNLIWTIHNDQQVSGANLPSTTSDWQLAGIGDFNGDGSGDLLWHDSNGQNMIWNIQNDQLIGTATLPTTSSDWHIAGIGDFNADGSSDILWHDDDGQNLIWTIHNDRQVSGANLPSTTSDWQIAGTGDFNGDGTSDILWRGNDGQNLVWNIHNDQQVGGANLPLMSGNWHVTIGV